MNHNLSEIQDLNELSNRDSRSNYSVVSEDLGQQLLQLIQEYQPNPQDQMLLEMSKQKTVIEIDEKFRNSQINQTYVFPRKVTQRDRNKAKELSQILANSTQNKYTKSKQQQSQAAQPVGINKNQQFQNANNSGSRMFTEQGKNDQMQQENDDDSFSSLNDCTFYDLNSQNQITHPKGKTMQQQQQQYVNSMPHAMQLDQSTFMQSQQVGYQVDQSSQIKHSYYAPLNLQKQQQPTQFSKSMINQHIQQPINAQQQGNGFNINQQHFNQFDMVQSSFKDSDMINIEINFNENEQMLQQGNNLNDENKNTTKSEVDHSQNMPVKNQKTLMNNLVFSTSNAKKANSSTKNNGLKDFNSQSVNTNQLIASQQQNGTIPQRRPLTETSPNAKNFTHLNQTTDLIQGISSSTGTTTIIGEQIASVKNKGSITNSNKSDINLKNPRVVSTQVKGVFTEADEEDEDTQQHTKEDWNEEAKGSKIKQEQEGMNKQQKITYMATEGDALDKSPSKQYYNIPTQFINAKVRKLKIASFHHQKEQPNKLTQSVSIHNYVEPNFNHINSNLPNTNSFLPLTLNNQQFPNNNKLQNQLQLDKLSQTNQVKTQNVGNYPYDLSDIQVNNNLTSKSAKQNSSNNQQTGFQMNNQTEQQQINSGFNKLLNFPQTTQNSSSAQKQFTFNGEGKLVKNTQVSSSTQGTANNNYNIYSNFPNTTNIQNSKFVNMSLDYQNQDNRFTPIRQNKIPNQVQKLNQSSITNNTFNNYLHNNNNDEVMNQQNNNNSNNIQEYTLSKSNTKNRNINPSLPANKGAQLNEMQHQEFTPTSSQANQLHKRNKTSIRKMRPKLNIDGSFNDFNETIGNTTKESHISQIIDPSPYTGSKHMRNLTLNSYYLKPSTTKNSHQRQPSDNMLRNSIINRVFTDKSEEKIKTTNISQCTSGIGGAAAASNKVVLTESGSANNNRCPTGNNSKVKRTLKIQSCKYNAQKNSQLQEQFKSQNQQSNLPNSSKNVAYLSNLLLSQEEESSQSKNFYKLEQPKNLSHSKKEVSNTNDSKKIEKGMNLQNDHLNGFQSQQFYQQNNINQQQAISTKNQQTKDISVKEMLRQTNGRRYLKTDGDDLNEGFQFNENNLFQTNSTEDKYSQNQILLHKNYSTNGDLNIGESSGMKTNKSNQQQRINIQQQYQNEDRFQQNSKSRSEENRITMLAASAQMSNATAINNEINKKRIASSYKNNSIGKSLTSTQPLTLESYSTENPHSHQQSEQHSNNAVAINKNQKINYYVKQGSNQNIKNTKIAVIVTTTETSQSMNGNTNEEENKNIAIQQMNIKINTKSTIMKANNNDQSNHVEVQDDKSKISLSTNKKSEQLNQILVQHTQKEQKPQPLTQTIVRQVKKSSGQATSYHVKTNSLFSNVTGMIDNIQKNNQDNSVQTRKLVACSLHEDNLKSLQAADQTQNQLLQNEQEKSNANTNTIAGGQIQKSINKTVGYENIYVKQTINSNNNNNNNNSTQKQKGSQVASSLSASTDQSSNIHSGSNGGTGVNFGAQITASSTQSNQSKNKSPMRLNFISPTNNFIPQPPQHPSSTRNQVVGGLYKKKAHQLYQSVQGQSQQQTNVSSYQ